MRDTTKILTELRGLMKNLPNGNGSISAYIVPSEDAHQVCENYFDIPTDCSQSNLCQSIRANTFVKRMNVEAMFLVSMEAREQLLLHKMKLSCGLMDVIINKLVHRWTIIGL